MLKRMLALGCVLMASAVSTHAGLYGENLLTADESSFENGIGN